MSIETYIAIPKGMKAQDVAEVFNAYLLASRSSHNSKNIHGPFLLDGKWQLDGSNDYWMHEVEKDRVMINCRYPKQHEVVDAMARLFHARYRIG